MKVMLEKTLRTEFQRKRLLVTHIFQRSWAQWSALTKSKKTLKYTTQDIRKASIP